jgi:hypothetical protein
MFCAFIICLPEKYFFPMGEKKLSGRGEKMRV